MESPDTLDIHQAAAMLHADEETVLALARSGELPGTKIGRPWVFLRADVLDYLRARVGADTAQRRQAATAPPAVTALAATVVPQRSRRRTSLPVLPDLSTIANVAHSRSP